MIQPSNVKYVVIGIDKTLAIGVNQKVIYHQMNCQMLRI